QDNEETGDTEAKAKCRRDSGRCVGATAPESGYGQVPVIIVKDVMETKMSAGKANSLDKMLECVVTDVAERDSERAAIYAATVQAARIAAFFVHSDAIHRRVVRRTCVSAKKAVSLRRLWSWMTIRKDIVVSHWRLHIGRRADTHSSRTGTTRGVMLSEEASENPVTASYHFHLVPDHHREKLTEPSVRDRILNSAVAAVVYR
ncbi:hypothetical protein F443_08930, partial [Phytophthora nicotianae P1569]